jgi:hypothetical protein
MKMKTGAVTDKQQRALDAMTAARHEGCTLTKYARTHGLDVRELYDALAALRRRGVLPQSGRKPPSRFVAVRVAQPTAMSAAAGMVCRIVQREGCVIECCQWPPASWLSTLVPRTADAAPRS